MFEQLLIRRILGFVAAICGALLAIWLNMPLPWLLGPMLMVAALRLSNAPVSAYKPLRTLGHWAIGTSLGLYFSKDIINLFVVHWIPILIGTVAPLLISTSGTLILRYVGKADWKTAWFASAIGGASEMSTLAERYNARVDLVASAHCLRILAVVIVIPFGFRALVAAFPETVQLSQRVVEWNQMPLLMTLTLLSGFVFFKLKLPIPWVLGAMAMAATLSISGVVHTSLPMPLVNLGQLMIGWSLGDNYRPAFFKAAPRFLLGVAVFTVAALLIAAGVGYLIAYIADFPLYTVWLGLSPGGLAEMALTAKALGLDVPVVTAFQVSRLVFVVLVTGWLYKNVVVRLISGSEQEATHSISK